MRHLALCLSFVAGVNGLAELVDFPVGVAVAAGSEAHSFLKNTNQQPVIKAQFNQLTPGNIMKMSYLHPSENTYTYTDADALVSWATTNGLSVHGHTFIWHSDYQVPSWMKSYTGNFQTMLNTHVTTIATHFKGKLKSWDVVNEVLDSSQSSCYRNSLFYQKLGKYYIHNAYKAARAADPSALLYYNDYDTEASTAKLACLTKMVDDMIASGVPIDGVGFQMHVYIDYPSIATIKNAFTQIVKRGLKVKMTELDVPLNNPYASTAFPQYKSLTSAASATQKARYKAIVQAYLDVVPAAQRGGITIWGLWDGDSWLMDLPEWKGAADWPLLYTGAVNGPFTVKDAFYGVQEALSTAGKSTTPTPAKTTPTPAKTTPTPAKTTPSPTSTPSSTKATITDGTYTVVSKYSSQYMEVADASLVSGANVQQYPLNNNGNQQWTFTSLGSGYYKIINKLSGMSLDVAGASTADAANVLQFTYKGSTNQQWYLVSAGSGYYAIYCRNSGKVLDLAGPSMANGANIQQYSSSGAANQLWKLTAVSSSSSSSSSCSTVIAAWGDCSKGHKCCTSGYSCYEANQWYAQCRTSCSVSGWSCTKLG